MRDKVKVNKINEIKKKNEGVELTIKSCFPEGQTLEEQAAKVDEEMNEVVNAITNYELSQEALDLAVASIGLAEIALNKIDRIEEYNTIEVLLQDMINEKYREKQAEWEAIE